MEAIAEVGRALAARGEVEAARSVFERLVALEPGDADCQAALATLYTRLARFGQAMAAYAEALRLRPGHVVALANRGALRLARGDDGGLADLEAAVRADPRGRSPEGARARALLEALRARPDRLARAAPSGHPANAARPALLGARPRPPPAVARRAGAISPSTPPTPEGSGPSC